MLRPAPNTHQPLKWAAALRREMQIAIGQQLRLVRELPKELPPELASLLIRKVKEHDPYYDVVGTC